MKQRPKHENRLYAIQSLAASLVIILFIWWSLAIKIDVPYILPKPSVVLDKLITILLGESFWQVILGTMTHVLQGFGIAIALGVVTGIAAGRFRFIHSFVYPWVLLLRTTPVMSFILYLLLFVATDWVSVWVSVFIVYPMIHVSVLEGYRQVDPKLLEMANLHGVPLEVQLKRIYFPSILPYFMTAAVTGMGVNIKAVITAEAMSLPEFSIGTELFNARNYLETETILAWTLLIIAVAVVMDGLLFGLKWLVTEGRRKHALSRRQSEL